MAASLSSMKTAMYRHENGLKHINIINNEGFSALFVVKTPIFDNSGVAHGVEHGVFRRSSSFPQPETLFQLTQKLMPQPLLIALIFIAKASAQIPSI